jgi:hypothetical protein
MSVEALETRFKALETIFKALETDFRYYNRVLRQISTGHNGFEVGSLWVTANQTRGSWPARPPCVR